MNCKIEKSKLSGKIICPPNKSYTHRAIFLASLASGESKIENVLHSADTKATIEACKKFGAKINEKENSLIINSDSKIHASTIDAANSGTTIRIATAIASLDNGKTTLSGDSSLNQRPMKPLLDALESIGAKCSSNDGKPPVEVSGIIKGGQVSIPGNISSQFVSALMISAPLTQNGVNLNIEGDLVSKPYLDATITIMKKFGVNVKTDIPYKKYSITKQAYKPTSITIPSDFSSLALLLCSSVLIGKDLQIIAKMSDLPQGDEYFLKILKKVGVDVNVNTDMITVKSPEKIDGGKFDLGNTPDLLPPLSVLALKTKNPIEIFNVKHARYKETDRIAILVRELKKLGIKIEEKEDGMILHPPDKLKGAILNSENDHRLFMAFCIAGMFVGDCTISDSESVNVSYPNFIVDMNRIGGRIKLST
jgi:3-phosphoshikimate 1-carboxyvinyltransferase